MKESDEEESEDDYETRTAQASMCTKDACVHMCICDYKLRTKWIAPYQVDGSVFFFVYNYRRRHFEALQA